MASFVARLFGASCCVPSAAFAYSTNTVVSDPCHEEITQEALVRARQDLELDVEYNPWYADSAARFRPGVVSAYGNFILRFPMRFERVNLRTTLQLGASRMMFDLFGVPEGTIGPYVGFNLLGIDYELGEQLYLVVNPARVAFPIPETTGAPFSYPQYRMNHLGPAVGSMIR